MTWIRHLESAAYRAAHGVVEVLRGAGHQAYFAGGCVRDLLLGVEPKDFDVATSARPEEVQRLFRRTEAVGAHFGVVLVIVEVAEDPLAGRDAGLSTPLRSGRDDRASLEGVEDLGRDAGLSTAASPSVEMTVGGMAGEEKTDAGLSAAASPSVEMTAGRASPLGGMAEGMASASGGSMNRSGGRVAIEVATFRHDGAYTDGRRPDAVRFSESPLEDVRRRDFTINGMMFDVVQFAETDDFERSVLDFVGGRDDLRRRVVRAIGDPEVRFAEDKLRMLRGVRFAARLGFDLSEPTAEAMARAAGKIGQVSAERVRDELTRMLTEGHARRAFELLDEVGLLAEVLPEAVRMHGVEQPPEWHPEGDVWVHTMLLLEKLEPGCAATLGWGALLHDIGKPATFQIDRSGKDGYSERIRFSGHVEVGVRIAEEICNRFRFSNEDTAQIVALVKHHMRFGDVPQMREATVKRFLRLPKFDEHLRLHWLDCTSCHGRLGIWQEMTRRYEEEPTAQARPRLLLTGRDLIENGYKPGPRFKEMLEAAEDAQLEGAVRSTEEAMRMVRERFGAGGDGVSAAAVGLWGSSVTSSGTWDLVVVGAGMAGLGCARVLAERGLRVCVVESRERVGGRVQTERVGGQVVELGAEFVHGRPEELLALIADAGLHVEERGGAQVSFADGRLSVEDGEGDRLGALDRLRGFAGEDVGFADWLAAQKDVSAGERAAVTRYVEGFNAADARLISARSLAVQQAAEEAIGGAALGHVREGYSHVAEWLADRVRAAGGEVRCGVTVEAVRWGVGRVAVETTAGEFVGAKAVITLPLGVLQAGGVRIVPEPRAVMEPAGLMRMGEVCRFSMVFKQRWWKEMTPQPAMRELSFLFDEGARSDAGDGVGVWWTTYPEQGAVLTGWVGGPRARGFLANSEDELRELGVRQVARMFGVSEERVRAEMVGFGTYDWSADPQALGAYSYVGVGGVEASARMGEPVEHTLYFAGEHTDVTGHWGTVHGALRSGLRTARQVLEGR